jgi:hypothetical protein
LGSLFPRCQNFFRGDSVLFETFARCFVESKWLIPAADFELPANDVELPANDVQMTDANQVSEIDHFRSWIYQRDRGSKLTIIEDYVVWANYDGVRKALKRKNGIVQIW